MLFSVLLHSTFKNISGALGNPTCEALEFKWVEKNFLVKDSNMDDSLAMPIGVMPNTPAAIVYHFNKNPKDENIEFDSRPRFQFPCNLDLPDGANDKSFTITVASTGFADCEVLIELVSPFFIIDFIILILFSLELRRFRQ